MRVSPRHAVKGTALQPPFPPGMAVATFGMGCFWGAERKFCSGRTGHAEVVQVVYDPQVISYDTLLRTFWEAHDPTQGMRQGNDVGTQYRSAIYTSDDAQKEAAEASRDAYQKALTAAGLGGITTEIRPAPEYYFAEDYHQQYLHKNPNGYCGIGGTGVSCPAGLGVTG
jgi:peptide-methionine (S)-S-oxide reductase